MMNRRSFLRSAAVALAAIAAMPKEALLRLADRSNLWWPDTGRFRSPIPREIIKPTRTFYVGAGGSDSGQGLSWKDRLSTLQAAEDLVGPGDTIIVGPGSGWPLTVEKSGTLADPIISIEGAGEEQ